MGREVRMVPANWEHPRNERGYYEPLYDNYDRAVEQFAKDIEKMGLAKALEENDGGPRYSNYMHPEGPRTHYMMYEDTSEGTPISPAFATPEKLARWLVDNNASSFGDMTATYDQFDWARRECVRVAWICKAIRRTTRIGCQRYHR